MNKISEKVLRDSMHVPSIRGVYIYLISMLIFCVMTFLLRVIGKESADDT